MEIIKIIFFSCLFLTVYSYAVYPLAVMVLGFFLRRRVHERTWMPRVTIIISAFNEEKVIAKKIENSLRLEYPRELLEIIVVSDHSKDCTDAIVQGYADRDVILLAQAERMGKTAGLNKAVEVSKGEFLVFSDADAMYEPDAIKKMVSFLSDEKVGLVTGSTNYVGENEDSVVETSSIYTKLERFIKRHESRAGSCVGADGAIFSMRKSLYQPLKIDDINDFVLPLSVVKKGFRVVFREDLFCTEAASSDSKKEFQRQIRITNRTLRALFRHTLLMNPFKFPMFSFELISHKLVRLSVPIFLAVVIPLNMLLIQEGYIYKMIFFGQCFFYMIAYVGRAQELAGKKGKLSILYHFVMLNISILSGWRKYLSGETYVTWSTK